MFVFALTGTLGEALDEIGRSKIDRLIRKYNANFPSNSLIFDFFVNPGLKVGFQIKSSYQEIFAPTIDITRNKILIQALLKNNQNPFILGGIATGKSQIIYNILNTLELTKYQPFSVIIWNFK